MKNEKLFEYAVHSMRESGGDGDTTVLLKQQLVEDVAKEFEEWAKTNWSTVEKKVTASGVLFSEEQEGVYFIQWENFREYQKNEGREVPLSRGDYLFTDNIIITW